jgi:hypothetical protein
MVCVALRSPFRSYTPSVAPKMFAHRLTQEFPANMTFVFNEAFLSSFILFLLHEAAQVGL